jgi:formylglycine-generating enzyme required for sulfatase activity
MVGTVWQWTSDRLLRDYPYQSEEAQKEADTRDERVMRGSCWHIQTIRIAMRATNYLGAGYFDCGMRLVLDVPAEEET